MINAFGLNPHKAIFGIVQGGIFDDLRNISLKKLTSINLSILKKIIKNQIKIKAEVKLPNDILIKKQKIGGILQETVFKEKKKFLIVGIGINVNKRPKIKKYPTNFINSFTKKNVTKLQIFKLLCKSYEKKIYQFK